MAIIGVAYVHRELQAMLVQYELIADCLGGEKRVKYRRELYLPMVRPEDRTVENVKRYEVYLRRAIFYNVAERTLEGLLGQIFMRDPQPDGIPAQLDAVVKDANGEGVSLDQLAQKATKLDISYGRAGIWVDYPPTNGETTVAQQQSGEIRPTIHLYKPFKIINWHHKKVGAKKILDLVVLEEEYEATLLANRYDFQIKRQWRVLQLDPLKNNIYTVTVYREESPNVIAIVDGVTQYFEPKDANGNNLTDIPFKFLGTNANDPDMDDPPMYAICSINIGHYRNSADYEESIHMHGQATPWAAGLTEAWLQEVLHGSLDFGAHGGIPLPTGATIGMLQADANGIAKEAMDSKERQMVALGAKLVQQVQVQRTATEADQENTSEASVLSKIAKNVSAGFEWALGICGQFAISGFNPNDNPIQYDLNSEFDLVSLSPQERQELVAEWKAGAISWTEMRASLKQAGVATQEDTAAKAEIQKDQAEAYANMPEPATANENNDDTTNKPAIKNPTPGPS